MPSKPKPPEVLIGNIAEASQNAKGIYFIYVGLLAFCALTVAGTSDRQIVMNEPTTLPIINVQVSIEAFFILAPLLSIFFFVYLQIYLGKLNRLISDLRSNYGPLDEGQLIYPWMLNFVDEKGAGWAARFIVNFSVWWSLPVVLMLLALWYLKKHEPTLGYVIGFTPLLGTLLVVGFWQGHSRKLELEINEGGKSFPSLFKLGLPQSVLLIIVLVSEIVFFVILQPRALAGEKIIGFFTWPNVDVSYQNLISKQDTTFTTLYWADLNSAKLQGANFTGAILQKADLRDADLSRANFTNAVLKDADLRGAKLINVTLQGANLEDAKLDSADLQGSNCDQASFIGASIAAAKLTNVSFRESNFLKANFSGYDLRNLDFFDAELELADFSNTMIEGTSFRGANLRGALFYGVADTTTADFRGAIITDRNYHEFETKDPPFRPSRKRRRFLCRDSRKKTSVVSMLRENAFYDYEENKTSPGYNNDFELQRRSRVVTDRAAGLTWQRSGSKKLRTFKQAQDYVLKLNKNKYAGFDDWRLPTLGEAMSVMEPEKKNGLHIDPIFDDKQRYIWTTDQKSNNEAWIVGYSFGFCTPDEINYINAFARAVRSFHLPKRP